MLTNSVTSLAPETKPKMSKYSASVIPCALTGTEIRHAKLPSAPGADGVRCTSETLPKLAPCCVCRCTSSPM